MARKKRQPRKTHPAIVAAWIGGGCAIVAAIIGGAAVVAAAFISRPPPPIQDHRYDSAPAESSLYVPAMGHRNRDRIAAPPSPLSALSLAEIHIAGWEVRASCNRCRTSLRVSLPALMRAQGPDVILWGKHSPCPGFECSGGALTYFARAIPSGSWASMAQEPSPNIVSAWRAKRRTHDTGPRNV